MTEPEMTDDPLPEGVRIRAERILDRAAARLLAEQLDRDVLGDTPPYAPQGDPEFKPR